MNNCDCKGSGYISDGSGNIWNNLFPCPNGCGQFHKAGDGFTVLQPDQIAADKFLDNFNERGEE